MYCIFCVCSELWEQMDSIKDEFQLRNVVMFDTVPILAVDACPSQGGGLLFYPDMKICYTYKLNFEQDLKVATSVDPAVFEMLNLLLALFVFKKKLVNLRELRLINDNTKIRSDKGNGLVSAVYDILNILKYKRGMTIVNNPDGDFNLKIRDNEKKFKVFADCLSKNKVFDRMKHDKYKNDEYSLKDVEFVEIQKEEMVSFIGKF
jgi:hypothetical protein